MNHYFSSDHFAFGKERFRSRATIKLMTDCEGRENWIFGSNGVWSYILRWILLPDLSGVPKPRGVSAANGRFIYRGSSPPFWQDAKNF